MGIAARVAEWAFWASCAWIAYAYAGYALALYALRIVRRRSTTRGDVKPSVSVVVAVHNGRAALGAKLDNLLRQDYPADRLEIIVADDASTDESDRLVATTYAPRAVLLVRLSERSGKERVQREALAVARGEVVVFTDVATTLDDQGLSTIVRSFADPTVGCVSSTDRFLDRDRKPVGEGLYVRYEMALRRLESDVHSLVGASGSFFAARREVLRDFSDHLQSDFRTALVSVRSGYRAVVDEEAKGYYTDSAGGAGEFQRKVRTVVRGLTTLYEERGILNPFRYGVFAWEVFSHKVVRWTVPLAMLAALASCAVLSVSSRPFRALLICQVAGYGYALATSLVPALSRNPIGRTLHYLVQVNASILIAWYRFLRGERVVFWTPTVR
jgi:cellulose synthase/poly-beta-1,6-N-acetylglucosamine synthase-like glycosyltransferase